MICDVITYNGEDELFEIRYNVLKEFVSEFRVVEFDKTFSGKPKGKTFDKDYPGVKHYYVTEEAWGRYRDLAISSPNTEYGKGAEHWITEFCQKESIKDCLADLRDDDMVFIGDCDEIWNPESTTRSEWGLKLKLKVYSYFLNNRSSEEFWGTINAHWGVIKNKCLNHVRVSSPKSEEYHGWHFTSMGGHERVQQKLTDSYTEETYASQRVLKNLKENIDTNKDFLGRRFRYVRDETEWPEYLRENKEKYTHLCLN